MLAFLAFTLLPLVGWAIVSKAWSWRKDYRLAKTTGFPVFVSPVHISDSWWMMLYPLLLPVIEKLPSSLTRGWLPIAKLWKFWKMGYRPFAEVGSDTFILSTTKGNVLYTCDHSIVYDLLTQHPKVQVPVDLVGFYDIWGPTVGSTEGEEWKAYRKVISAGFSQAMNATVWKEAQRQTQMLVTYLETEEGSIMATPRDYTSKLALHVISCGFFNVQMDWTTGKHTRKDVDTSLPKSLPFDEALVLLIRRLSTVFVTPRGLLHKLPFRMFQEASLALNETERYITQQRADVEAKMETVRSKRNPSILEAIVISGKDPKITPRAPLLEKGVLGNMWFMLMAGHETVGSTLQFVFMLSAIYPEMQRKIQAQLDEQLKTRPAEQWTLEHDYASLQRGYIGAVQKEALSLYQPASFLLRRVVEPVTLIDSEGIAHRIPAGTLAFPNTSAAYKNPKVWKHAAVPEERRKALSDSPALYFNPDRWLDGQGVLKEAPLVGSPQRPVPDWWGFGQGPHACPGRAFAQIEMTSTMATLYRDYSLELVVEEELLATCHGDKEMAWQKTRDQSIRMLYEDVEANLTISVPTPLPLRVVKRASHEML